MDSRPSARRWLAACLRCRINCVTRHYLDEAAEPIFEADRHAKAELKKLVRGVRPIERSLEGQEDEQSEAMRSYCLAVPSRADR